LSGGIGEELTMSSENDDLFVEAAGEKHIEQFISTWVPFDMFREATDPWWTYQLFQWEAIIDHPDFTSVAAVSKDGNLEGLLATQRYDSHLKIEFLSTAPWNFGADRMRRGVGSSLLSLAVEASMQMGFGGSVVLSSTPESESFYERLRLERTGERDHEGLAVFRLPAERASGLLQHYPPLRQKKGRAV
jgi:ribosomal protein S18 acetylase RimI-like enzyme